MTITAEGPGLKIGIQTIVIFIGFTATAMTWGYTLARFEARTTDNSLHLDELTKRVVVLEGGSTVTDVFEVRITRLEQQVQSVAESSQMTATLLSGMNAEVKVIAEIVRRVEAIAVESQDDRREDYYRPLGRGDYPISQSNRPLP